MFDYRQMQFPGFPPGQGGPGFPSFPPGGQGQGFPGYPPGQQGMGQGQQAPAGPPPAFTPTQATAQTLSTGGQGPSAFAVDPGAIRGCLFRYTYLWLTSGQSFWFYPTFIGRQSISGFRWTGFRWVFYGTDLRRVRSFKCF
ncbi:transporter [Rossellomorea aquimaris]|nr:transporter [Rossellomorea aquimaris]